MQNRLDELIEYSFHFYLLQDARFLLLESHLLGLAVFLFCWLMPSSLLLVDSYLSNLVHAECFETPGIPGTHRGVPSMY